MDLVGLWQRDARENRAHAQRARKLALMADHWAIALGHRLDAEWHESEAIACDELVTRYETLRAELLARGAELAA